MIITITIAGYALTIIFATVSTILANSLRHRRKELEAADALYKAAQEELTETKKQLKQAKIEAQDGKLRTIVLKEVQDRLKDARAQLKTAYKRDGKRFVKIS